MTPRRSRSEPLFPARDKRVVALGLRVEHVSRDVIRALRAADVRPILLKGPLQQLWLERAGPARSSVDVDVLVSRDQLEASEGLLGSLGYRVAVGLPDEVGREHSSVWVSDGRVPVELHWSLVGVDNRLVWDVLSTETELASLVGDEVEIPNEAARCAIVALHAAQHGIGAQAIFHDLERALAVASTETWRRAAELATAMGGWTPFAGALSLSPRGREVLRALGAEPPVLDERQALSLLTPAPTSRGFYFLSRQRGAGAKAAFVVMKLAPSPTFMRLRYPLARRGGLGLALAYLYRPFWLLRWALPGLRSWREARRLANESRTAGSGDKRAR